VGEKKEEMHRFFFFEERKRACRPDSSLRSEGEGRRGGARFLPRKRKKGLLPKSFLPLKGKEDKKGGNLP